MLPALIRAAYAAGGNADCLYQVLVVISKLAALQGFTGKEKIQLYKMIGDLAPKCNEHFEEIWLSLGQIAPNNVGPSDITISFANKITWAEYLASKAVPQLDADLVVGEADGCPAKDAPTPIVNPEDQNPVETSRKSHRKRSGSALENRRSSKRLTTRGSVSGPEIWSETASSSSDDDDNNTTNDVQCSDESILCRKTHHTEVNHQEGEADPLSQVDPIEIKLEQFETVSPLFEGANFLEFVQQAESARSTSLPGISVDTISGSKSHLKCEITALRTLLQRFETVNIVRHDKLLNEISKLRNMVWESLSRFDPMQAKRSAAASHIVQRDDFVAPKWPLFTSDEVIELNVNLGQPEYRDQVFCRLCEFRLGVSDDLRKTIKQYMERIFTYHALIKFSWSGKSSIDDPCCRKIQFEEQTHIISLVMDLIGTYPHVEIANELKYFMKRVPQNYRAKVGFPDVAGGNCNNPKNDPNPNSNKS